MKGLHRYVLSTLLLFAACADDESPQEGDSKADAASPPNDAGADAAVARDCYPNPKTHLEIINACTDAERIETNPVLPLWTGDGELPPLP